MKYILASVVLFISLATGHDNEKRCTEDNEMWSECGNLCEDNCENSCEPSFFLKFQEMNKKSNRHCKPGCYCAKGYVRDDEGECVYNMPGVCGK
jgi:Trypsin Inhibitor like cysteine rich domain